MSFQIEAMKQAELQVLHFPVGVRPDFEGQHRLDLICLAVGQQRLDCGPNVNFSSRAQCLNNQLGLRCREIRGLLNGLENLDRSLIDSGIQESRPEGFSSSQSSTELSTDSPLPQV